jgi:hypothetical protein
MYTPSLVNATKDKWRSKGTVQFRLRLFDGVL